MGVPYVFGNATTSIPLTNLDANFNTGLTIGNTTVGLGNTVTTLGNVTLQNVTVTSGSINASSNTTYGTANAVVYSNSSKIGTTSSALTFDGSNLGVNTSTTGTTATGNLTIYTTGASSNYGTSLFVTDGGSFGSWVQGSTSGSTAAFVGNFKYNFVTPSSSYSPYTNSGYGINMGSDNGIQFFSANAGGTGSFTPTERMRLDTSGNLLVGATSTVSSAKFLVAGINGSSPVFQGASSAGAYLFFRNNAQTTNGLQIGQGKASGSDNVGILYNNDNAALVFGTNGTEVSRFDASGNLLLNTTSSSGITARFIVQQDSTAQGLITCNNTRADNNNDGIVNFYRRGTYTGQIANTNSATTYTSASDYRLKENIAPMTGALEKVALLKPCTYTWKDGGEAGQGFIAHELQAVVPDCVVGEKDAVETYIDEDGKEQTKIKPQGVDTSFLVATLTAAIQELNAKVIALESQLGAK
jgi:Chaperone of endosialidase